MKILYQFCILIIIFLFLACKTVTETNDHATTQVDESEDVQFVEKALDELNTKGLTVKKENDIIYVYIFPSYDWDEFLLRGILENIKRDLHEELGINPTIRVMGNKSIFDIK